MCFSLEPFFGCVAQPKACHAAVCPALAVMHCAFDTTCTRQQRPETCPRVHGNHCNTLHAWIRASCFRSTSRADTTPSIGATTVAVFVGESARHRTCSVSRKLAHSFPAFPLFHCFALNNINTNTNTNNSTNGSRKHLGISPEEIRKRFTLLPSMRLPHRHHPEIRSRHLPSLFP